MMKRIGSLILCLCMVLALCSCGKIENEEYYPSSEESISETMPVVEETEVQEEEPDEFQALIDSGADNTVMDKDIKNILLIGNDRRPGQKDEMRSDAMLVASINLHEKKVKFLSIMRDMYIMCADGMNSPLNLTYYRGGMELLDKTIEETFGIHIDGNLDVDFYRFVDIMNIFGPLDIELYSEEAAWLNGSSTKSNKWYRWNSEVEIVPEQPWTLHAGVNTMNAEQVEDYCRLRTVGNSDFERVMRQQRVMQLIYEKLRTYDLPSLIKFFDDVIPYIHTDLSKSEILGYIYTLWSNHIDTFENYRIPLDGTVVHQTIQDENYGKLQIMFPDLEVNKKAAVSYIYGLPDYDDVLYTDDNAQAIINVTEKGYMGPTGDRTFSPSNGITRGSIAQIFYQIDGSPESDSKASFADVAKDKWYYDAVSWAESNKVITGNKNNVFSPETYITNQQLFSILYKYAKYKGYDTNISKKISMFKDSNEISDYAVEAMKWAKGHKLIVSNYCNPQEVTSRGELARIITAFEKYVKE